MFFYGTLRHAPLLAIVLGRSADDIDMIAAELPGHAVYAVKGQPFPMILPAPGASAPGLLVRGLSESDFARLVYYEGGFDYTLIERDLRTDRGEIAQAQVFFPDPGLWEPAGPWSLAEWEQAWAAMSLYAAREVMAFYGRRSAAEVALSFPSVRQRAAARLAAEQRAAPQQDRDVIVKAHRHAYQNYFGLDEMELQHRRNDGSLTPVLSRSALMQGQAIVILPYDPVRDRVLLVEQFRPPLYMIGDPAPWMWEPVAGMIDPGETPEETAYREVREEAHVELRALEPAGQAYSSSGSSTEYVYLYVGLADLTDTTDSGGLDSEGEDIRSAILSFDAFMVQVDANRFKDLPLLMLANWLARHRERLRAGA